MKSSLYCNLADKTIQYNVMLLTNFVNKCCVSSVYQEIFPQVEQEKTKRVVSLQNSFP